MKKNSELNSGLDPKREGRLNRRAQYALAIATFLGPALGSLVGWILSHL